jgi:hypothetical protein
VFGVGCVFHSLHTEGVRLGVGPEGDLGHDLVGERAGHDYGGVSDDPNEIPASSLTEGGVAGTAAEVDETALGEEDDVAARGHGEAVDLGLDVDVLDRVLLEPGDVDLDVKVADATGESAGNS